MTTTERLMLCAAMMYVPAAAAHDALLAESGLRECYGKAMIGYDTVINARLGLPPEHALALARDNTTAIEDVEYRDETLIVMWGAYLWESSPHNYALSVFYRCARDQDRAATAGRDP